MSDDTGKTPWPLVLLGGFALGCMASGGLAALSLREKLEAASMGWKPVTILVAQRDLPEGSRLGSEVLVTRTLPEQFVIPAMLTPADLARVENRRTRVPLKQGDPVETAFVDPKSPGLDCVAQARSTAQVLGLEGDPAVQGLLGELQTGGGP